MALIMATGHGGRMAGWVPVVYRGDGAWIGILPCGGIGVGVEGEGRATLESSSFVPMWPFMEKDLGACLDEFSRAWESLRRGGIVTPEELIELTVSSAWDSGRPYWMNLAAEWVVAMAGSSRFDSAFMRGILARMATSDVLSSDLRERLHEAG